MNQKHHDHDHEEPKHGHTHPRIIKKEMEGDLIVPDPEPDPGPPPPQQGPFQPSSYYVEILNYRIRNTRSWNEDTVYGCLAARASGAPDPQVAMADFGDQNNGLYRLADFKVGPYQMNSPTSRLSFAYIYVNSSKGSTETGRALTAEANGLLQYGMVLAKSAKGDEVGSADQGQLTEEEGGGDFLGTLWAAALSAIGGAVIGGFVSMFKSFFGGCDGPLVSDWQSLTGETLWRYTDSRTFRRTITYPGTDSATGCGSNSLYDVTYAIQRVAPRIVPRPSPGAFE